MPPRKRNATARHAQVGAAIVPVAAAAAAAAVTICKMTNPLRQSPSLQAGAAGPLQGLRAAAISESSGASHRRSWLRQRLRPPVSRPSSSLQHTKGQIKWLLSRLPQDNAEVMQEELMASVAVLFTWRARRGRREHDSTYRTPSRSPEDERMSDRYSKCFGVSKPKSTSPTAAGRAWRACCRRYSRSFRRAVGPGRRRKRKSGKRTTCQGGGPIESSQGGWRTSWILCRAL